MTTTIDIPEDVLRKAMHAAGTDSPREAIVKALEEFSRRRRQSELIKLSGTCDGFMTPEELDELRAMD